MSYAADTASLFVFDGTLPVDLINGAVTVHGTFVKTDGIHKKALQMNGTSFYEVGVFNSLASAFTIGFWLKPKNLGMITNPNTLATQPLKMALLSKSNSSYSAGTTTLSSEMFSVWEETQSNNKNVMKIRVKGSTTATITTSAYSVDIFHHFWIVYNGTSVSVYIDGALNSTSVSGTVPASISPTSAHLFINNAIDGHQYETSRNFGLLEDLVIFSTARTTKSNIFKVIDLGSVYIADNTLVNEDEVSFGSIFDDASTIQVNSICGNKGNVYIGRSDGLLLKGSRSLWESRRDFASADEINYVSVITRSTSNNYSISDGVLTVTNAIIRV